MLKKFYRRVWRWVHGTGWSLVTEGYIDAFDVQCMFDSDTFCSIAPPYVYERWWVWQQGTWGSTGQWRWYRDEQNW